MNYSSEHDFKEKIENRRKWSKANDYEVFAWNICMECQFYKADADCPTHGECTLMASNGCYNGVVYTAICNRYISKKGVDINGNAVNPVALPPWVKKRKNKKGESFVV